MIYDISWHQYFFIKFWSEWSIYYQSWDMKVTCYYCIQLICNLYYSSIPFMNLCDLCLVNRYYEFIVNIFYSDEYVLTFSSLLINFEVFITWICFWYITANMAKKAQRIWWKTNLSALYSVNSNGLLPYFPCAHMWYLCTYQYSTGREVLNFKELRGEHSCFWTQIYYGLTVYFKLE